MEAETCGAALAVRPRASSQVTVKLGLQEVLPRANSHSVKRTSESGLPKADKGLSEALEKFEQKKTLRNSFGGSGSFERLRAKDNNRFSG